MQESIINVLYYIKRVVFQGENESMTELIYVTKENKTNSDGIVHVTPEIIASSLRTIPLSEINNESLSFEEGEGKVYISEEEALKLSNLATMEVDPEFHNRITKLF
ncbi:hypothetical protein ACFFHF_17035 [Robertmurraya beringensis]|uniref:Uncharacterized protein n=1 Tax=Robertmurraya beringensis TaxID=641660 RepID=A0ABV6KUA8_9BACI